jgi:hypothetical protein
MGPRLNFVLFITKKRKKEKKKEKKKCLFVENHGKRYEDMNLSPSRFLLKWRQF